MIYKVGGFSAVCTDGTMLRCDDGRFLVKTGNNVKIKLTRKLAKVIVKIAVNDVVRWSQDIWYQIRNKIYMLKWTAKRYIKETFQNKK